MEHTGAQAAAKLRGMPTRLLTQVAVLADRAAERALADTGSRRHHFALLATLAEFGPASQAELGRRTGIDRSDIVGALNDLAGRGFVDRTPDPEDRRRNIVTITEPGAAHLADLDGKLRAAQQELLGALSEGERDQLVGLLSRVLDDHAGR
ncbi:MarR family winged helix-turn-helix transcriptional regulator [Nocardia ignorata]|uniref:MarR family winged helix-turn-helix transcriptional regulator n=1 Tax=Nocardia ignorata TaxID=145285 RepID=UPI00363546D1